MCKSVVCQISLVYIPKSAKCKNGICVCVYLCVCVCVCVPNIKLVKCKIGICLCVHVCICACVYVWYATYKLSIFGMFANEPKSAKFKIF